MLITVGRQTGSSEPTTLIVFVMRSGSLCRSEMGVRVNKIYTRIKESISKTGTWPSSYLAWKLSACFPIGDPNQMNEHTEASVSPVNKEGTQD